jgi:hypothetical protein
VKTPLLMFCSRPSITSFAEMPPPHTAGNGAPSSRRRRAAPLRLRLARPRRFPPLYAIPPQALAGGALAMKADVYKASNPAMAVAAAGGERHVV